MGQKSELRRVLTALDLWGIAVGLVISGEYFGWSYGWAVAGSVGFLISSAIVLVLYITFIFSFTELTTSIPHASGAFAYVTRALGPTFGVAAGLATLVELLFAPPAIALGLGSYLHFILPSCNEITGAVVVFLLFGAVNAIGVHVTARLELIVTIIAVIELLFFIGLVGPHFDSVHFFAGESYLGVKGVIQAIPYAIWFFLAIEGVASSAEEVRNPRRDIPIGYLSGLLTLSVLAFGVMLAAGGAGDWKVLSGLDYPIPEAMAMALGRQSAWVRALAGLGLFGLIASVNGIIYSASRQVYSLAKAGVLPKQLAQVSKRWKSPSWAILVTCLIGCASVLSGKTSDLISLSAMGAVTMYACSMVSLIVLRFKEPKLERPFRVPFYPVFPMVALTLSTLSLATMIYFNAKLGGFFFLGLLLSTGLILWIPVLRKSFYGRFRKIEGTAQKGEVSF